MSLPLTTRFGANPLLDLELANKNYVDNASGGGLTFAKAVTIVAQTITTEIVFQNVDVILFTATANKTYGFMIRLFFTSPATADIQFQFSLPAGASVDYETTDANGENTTATTFAVSTNGGNQQIVIWGQIDMAGTAGTVQLQFRQQASDAGDTTLHRGNFMVVWEDT